MGQVFYRDWSPGSFQDPTYNQRGALLPLESWHTYSKPDLPLQPDAYFDNRLSAPEFYLANIQGEYTADELIFYPRADDAYRFAPEQPVRRDVFMQLAQRTNSPNIVGQAPTRGVYTGINDLGYE